MQKSKLRIGLLLNGTELAAWAYRMIEIIKDSDYAEAIRQVRQSVFRVRGPHGRVLPRAAWVRQAVGQC